MTVQDLKNIQHFRSLFLRPGHFMRKACRKIISIWKGLIIDGPTRRIIEHNRTVWQGWNNSSAQGTVLVSWDEIFEYNIIMMYFANVLARKKMARIATFAFQKWFWVRSLHAVYRSFNAAGHVVMGELNEEQRNTADKIYDEILKTLKTKEDVFRLKVHDIHIGIDIYESYLREFNKPTVFLDKALFSVLRQAIDYLIFWEDYFERNKVVGVIVSHDNYVNYNIVCKVAYMRGVPVYAPLGAAFGFLKQAFDSYSFYYSYKTWFTNLSSAEKKQGIEWAKKQLEKRFSGEVGGDLFYVTESAFRSSSNAPKVLRSSEKLKVLICSHCFYDNPHAYGGMFFIDFYEWLKFLATMAEKTDYDWYLKTHPDPLPGTLETIREILGESSRITILPSKTSHHQLVQEGINCVLTVYGSVGHEYPMYGVQVVNAGYNPHAAFDFTWTPKSLKEYEGFILNLKDLKKNIEIEEIYEFYFMNYYYRHVDDLVFHSRRGILSQLNAQQRQGSDIYSYFLDGFTQQGHQESIRRIEDFIDSGKDYLYTKGPVNKQASDSLTLAYLG